MKRRRRKNPEGYWTGFAIAASAVVAILYVGRKIAGSAAR